VPTRPKEINQSISYHALAGGGLQELVVFSCDKNHMWTRQVFFETILPKFKTRIAALPTDLSVTAQFLLAEYHLVLATLSAIVRGISL
jgi:hypothetical protein